MSLWIKNPEKIDLEKIQRKYFSIFPLLCTLIALDHSILY